MGVLVGKQSAEALRARIKEGLVQCEVRNKDMYGRSVASCSVPDQNRMSDIGDWMVKNGHAVAYR